MIDNRKTLRETITRIMTQYKPSLMRAGISESQATITEKKYEADIPEAFFLEAVKYLLDIKNVMFEMERIYGLCPEHFWDNMKMLGFNDHREMIMLRKQSKLIRESWRLRPILLKHKQIPGLEKLKKEQNVEPESESEDTATGSNPTDNKGRAKRNRKRSQCSGPGH